MSDRVPSAREQEVYDYLKRTFGDKPLLSDAHKREISERIMRRLPPLMADE